MIDDDHGEAEFEEDSLGGRVVPGEDPPEDGVHPLRVVVGAEAAQRVLQQVRHGQRAQLLLHSSRGGRPVSSSTDTPSVLNKHRRLMADAWAAGLQPWLPLYERTACLASCTHFLSVMIYQDGFTAGWEELHLISS